MAVVITIPRRVIEHSRREAKKADITLEEYIIELLLQGLDPKNKAVGYIEVAQELLRETHEELRKRNSRQVAEKLWGAAALAVKAYALQREGRRLTGHRELWEYKDRLIDELGEWVYDTWMTANGVYTCFYEGWRRNRDMEIAVKRIEKLVKTVEENLMKTK